MGIVKFVLVNLGPILVFYTVNQFFGLQAAVLASVIWIIAEIVIRTMKRKPLTTFFKFTATLTIVFGVVDLYLQQSLLFKYEAAVSNIFVGLFFASSLFGEKPIIQEFSQARGRVSQSSEADQRTFFRFLTIVWSAYSFLKGGFYFWVAQNYSLEESLIVRATVGNVSFYTLLGLSIFAARPIKRMLGIPRPPR